MSFTLSVSTARHTYSMSVADNQRPEVERAITQYRTGQISGDPVPLRWCDIRDVRIEQTA